LALNLFSLKECKIFNDNSSDVMTNYPIHTMILQISTPIKNKLYRLAEIPMNAAHFLLPLLFLAYCEFVSAADADDPRGNCKICDRKQEKGFDTRFDSKEPIVEKYAIFPSLIHQGQSGLVSILFSFQKAFASRILDKNLFYK
jgi:hypothetical protein